jgi:hypothetical protein
MLWHWVRTCILSALGQDPRRNGRHEVAHTFFKAVTLFTGCDVQLTSMWANQADQFICCSLIHASDYTAVSAFFDWAELFSTPAAEMECLSCNLLLASQCWAET